MITLKFFGDRFGDRFAWSIMAVDGRKNTFVASGNSDSESAAKEEMISALKSLIDAFRFVPSNDRDIPNLGD